ncbi:LysE family translocator [Alkalimarinus alittae]|uniref:LysE family translocator n=1 Tax=Alkalimarinus alittae TaxID=2961619 RepID=A0ABY6MZQ8_9ALTE|nr:LysE family translocator [Alkalimarinus alittae]UZE95323.1 LysE family translocator [Alkalimarinus alittae]
MTYLSLSVLAVFIPTFFFVSITPGMCMTLALTMGMRFGLRKTLWMMLGELVGVALVASLSAVGVAALMLTYPALFVVLKYAGGAYLIYLGIQMWQSKGKMALNIADDGNAVMSKKAFIMQGFITAIANPKGWAFFIALLPPFLNYSQPLTMQLVQLIFLILLLEFICLIIYAGGGKSLRAFMMKSGNLEHLNRIAGTLLIGVGVWLASS